MKFQTLKSHVLAVFTLCSGLALSERRLRFLNQLCSILLFSLMALGALVFAARGQSVYPTPYTFNTLAGGVEMQGSVDGVGSAARFSALFGIAVDNVGNVYVSDSNSHTIRKITPDATVTTLAGTAGEFGSADGIGGAARFFDPYGVAVDGAGNVYVADERNSTIRKITPGGTVTTLAGSAMQYGSVDGIGSAARFRFPFGVAVDSAANVYVADSSNHTIRKITPGGTVTTLAGSAGQRGSADGTGSAARFDFPEEIAVDSAFNVYVGDGQSSTIRKITQPAVVVTTLAGSYQQSGSTDGIGSAARFDGIEGVAVDSAGSVYVAEKINCTIRKITQPSGAVTTLAGSVMQRASVNGTGSAVRFHFPLGTAVDSAGYVYVADTANCTIRKGAPPCQVLV